MKQKIFFLLFCLASFRASAQTIVDPADFPVMSSPTLSNWAIYTREDHVNRKVLPTAIRALMLPIVRQPADITYTPAATGNANDKGSFVKTPTGRVYFIDGLGNSIQSNFPYAAATIADNDVHAGVMCVPVGGWYRLSNANTLGMPPGTLRQRVFGTLTPCTNAANPISPGQTAVVGGSGVLKVNGDPDTNPYVKAQGQHYESSVAYDTLHKKVYTYDFAGSVGNRWNVFEGVSVDTRVDTAYIQNDTLKMLVLDVGEDTIQKTINVALIFPTVTETGLVSPLPSVGRPGSVVIKTIDINNNVALYFSDGSDWLGPFEIPGVKNVDSTMLGPKQVYGLHLAQSGATTGQVYKWNGTNWAPANESSVLVIQEEGTDLTLRQKLNFVGSAATASDDSGNGRTNVTFDSDVNGLASNSNSGIIVRTSAGNFTGRTLSGSEGITLTNANGVSGDPTISPANDLLALEMLNNPGVPYRTGSDTWSITPANFSGATSGQVLKWNGSAWVAATDAGQTDALGTGFTDGGGSGTIPDGTVASRENSKFYYGYDGNPDAIAWLWDDGSGYYNRILNNADGLDVGSFDDNSGASMRMSMSGGSGNFSASNGTLTFNAKSNGTISFDQQTCFLRFSNGDDNVVFEDTRATPVGIEYNGDYSATIKSNARSIPDVGTVRQIIADSVGNSGHVIREEGSNLTARPYLNFVGAAATAADNSGTNATDVSFDGDLNAIAAISTTNGVLRKTAANTWALFAQTFFDDSTFYRVTGKAIAGFAGKRPEQKIWKQGNLILGKNLLTNTTTLDTSGTLVLYPRGAADGGAQAAIKVVSTDTDVPVDFGNNNMLLKAGLLNIESQTGTYQTNQYAGFDTWSWRSNSSPNEVQFYNETDFTNPFSISTAAASNSFRIDGSSNIFLGNASTGAKLNVINSTSATGAIVGIENSGGVSRMFRSTASPETVISSNAGDVVITPVGIYSKNTASSNTGYSKLSGTLFTQTADKTVSNTTTQTSIIGTGVGITTLPSGFLIAGRTIRLKVSGIYSTVAIPGNVIVRVKLGSTTIASATTSGFVTGAANDFFDFETTITCRTTGGSGTVMSNGIVSYAGASGPVFDAVNNGGSTATVATNSSQALDVTVEWDTADAGKIIKTTTCVVEVIN